MTDTSPHNFNNIVQELTGWGNSRTWSILVTIFGDLAQNPEDEISGALLSSLTQLIGIKPQAMRVALHRLRRDGWITTERSGRTSKHRLSEFGLDQSKIASPLIYAQTVEAPDTWHVLIANPEAQVDEKLLLKHRYRCISSGVYIGAGAEEQGLTGFLVVEGTLSSIPEWLQALIADAVTVAEHSRFKRCLDFVEGALNNGYKPTVIETAVIRTLIVHDWRRIVLRQPDMSFELFPPSATVQCRTDVWKLLDQLERPTLKVLEAAT